MKKNDKREALVISLGLIDIQICCCGSCLYRVNVIAKKKKQRNKGMASADLYTASMNKQQGMKNKIGAYLRVSSLVNETDKQIMSRKESLFPLPSTCLLRSISWPLWRKSP